LARRLRRLGRLLGATRVEEAAACARALASLSGSAPVVEALPGGAERLTRALLTARMMAAQEPVPWSWAVTRQLDPDDSAFLPNLDMHPVLAARDRTCIGLPDGGAPAWVDPSGWCGVGLGAAVSVWFGDARNGTPAGPRPERGVAGAVDLQQRRSEDELGVVTTCRWNDLRLEMTHWPVRIDGEVCFVLSARLSLEAGAPRPARLGFAIRPAGFEGAAPLFHLNRDSSGLWRADGAPLLAVARNGDEIWTGVHGQVDPWRRFSGAVVDQAPLRPGPIDLRCPGGMASAVELWRTTLSPDEPLSRFALIAPPPGAPALIARTSAPALWQGATADRKGLMSAGSEFELVQHQALVRASRQRLLLDDGGLDTGAALGAVALARAGFVRRAGDRLAGWLSQVKRDGSIAGAEVEDGAVLAWAAAEYVRWTGARSWLGENQGPWTRLLDRLARTPIAPGGQAWFGRDGSARWSSMWRAAALLNGVVALRDVTPSHQEWAMVGGREREGLLDLLGEAPWTPAPGRSADGASALLLAVCWLGLLPPDHPAALATAQHIRQRHWHGGGVLLRGGANAAATALVGAVLDRAEKEKPGRVGALGTVAALASGTFALPTARHPVRGALDEGDDRLAAAMFLLLALDRVRATRQELHLLPGVVRARNLPTPFGPVDVTDGVLTGRWRGHPPTVRVVEGQVAE
jgi:hypothetical protein